MTRPRNRLDIQVRMMPCPNPQLAEMFPFCFVVVSHQTDKSGYPRIFRDGKSWVIHRYWWTTYNGPIPHGKVLCHQCDNRRCINLDHLQVGDQMENVRQMHERDRFVPCPGEKNGRAKLTWSKVRHIRSSDTPASQLAREFGVSPETIRMVRRGLTWK